MLPLKILLSLTLISKGNSFRLSEEDEQTWGEYLTSFMPRVGQPEPEVEVTPEGLVRFYGTNFRPAEYEYYEDYEGDDGEEIVEEVPKKTSGIKGKSDKATKSKSAGSDTEEVSSVSSLTKRLSHIRITY